jgi:hypothetical protein
VNLARCRLQKEPARQLPNLQKLPMAIVTGALRLSQEILPTL